MRRLLFPLFLTALAGTASVAPLAAQEIPGLRATLSTPRSLVAAGSQVELLLVLQVDADTEVPGDLLTGVKLAVHVADKQGPRIEEAGKGGKVALAAGTRIERKLSFPTDRLAPNTEPNAVTPVAIAWDGLAGANCVVKIAPDASKIDLAALDMAKTQVVLVTNYGEMTLSFRPDKAPKTVENFLKLCKEGFYDGTKFHRVIRNFMIQGGDPNTRDDDKAEAWGQGGPGYSVDAEFNDLKHLRGTLSMARSADPNSAGSQFFIVHKDSAHLDNQYTAFGNLEKGMDVLDAIAGVRCGGAQNSTPVQPVILMSTVILPAKK
jgi:peptidyl-prolyl cis-trans isomerase B (cyclophilin B)